MNNPNNTISFTFNVYAFNLTATDKLFLKSDIDV